MPTSRCPAGTAVQEAQELTELSAILRSIATSRKSAASALRNMAERYEMRAVALQISRSWEDPA